MTNENAFLREMTTHRLPILVCVTGDMTRCLSTLLVIGGMSTYMEVEQTSESLW